MKNDDVGKLQGTVGALLKIQYLIQTEEVQLSTNGILKTTYLVYCCIKLKWEINLNGFCRLKSLDTLRISQRNFCLYSVTWVPSILIEQVGHILKSLGIIFCLFVLLMSISGIPCPHQFLYFLNPTSIQVRCLP